MKRNSFLNDDPLSWISILWETHLTANLPLLSVITMTQLFTPYLGTLIPSRTIRKRSGNMHDYVRLQHITFLNLTADETPNIKYQEKVTERKGVGGEDSPDIKTTVSNSLFILKAL